MDFSNGSLQWNVNFIRLVHDWEVNVLASFYPFCIPIEFERDGEDKLWWTLSRKEKFNVRSFYKILACIENPHFPWKSIRRTKPTPPPPPPPVKVAFVAWSAALGKILIIDNLGKQHLIVVNRLMLLMQTECYLQLL
jgi:hypothetical protein